MDLSKREKRLEKMRIYGKHWRERNKEHCKKYRESRKSLNNEYQKTRLKNDVLFKLSSKLRNRLNMAIKQNVKKGSAVSDLGCTIEELKTYLENLFQPGMSWENYGREGWHIDHIKPLISFDLTDKKEFLKACHYTNLQPLWAKDNRQKKNKILKEI